MLFFAELWQPCGEFIVFALETDLMVFRSVSDADGPKIADTFYETLFERNGSATKGFVRPDTTQAARALHLAVAKLRSEHVSFIRWVPFIHLGR